MAIFNITGNGTAAGQALGSPSTALFMAGVFDGSKVNVEASPDNVDWAIVARSQDLSVLGQGQGAVAQCVLPTGWYVRTVTVGAGPNTAVKVVIQ